MLRRRDEVHREMEQGELQDEPGREAVRRTRKRVVDGWRDLTAILDSNAAYGLAEDVRKFAAQIPAARTERELLAEQLVEPVRSHTVIRAPPTK